ncbi:TIGR01244 family sulfur transferase [Sphingobium nicotianae]|uniref:TIGR01244 family phosphatase n=1 Tax=Sphingobium nicotianae TaxID=2782607 RepID=A0A9X1DEJ7_9SPHN|nr:TIGR01244 family sulfur transferase [Sphingobium nicotianae]MBT2188747.1 TIGR01244 family phosphatase [Sphingobium nicotianae]
MLKQLTSSILVAPQIGIETVEEAKALGVTLIVNNRPEDESPDQTPGGAIAAAARAAGIAYIAIPVSPGGFAPWQLDALDKALADNEGNTLCYCRSGTRSTLLWSLTRARAGDSPDEIAETAALAGYDVTPIREMMHALAGAAKS